MAFGSVPSESLQVSPEPLSLEAQNNVNKVANEVMAIIDSDPETEKDIIGILQKGIMDSIIKNPLIVVLLLRKVDDRFQERLRILSPLDRLGAIKGYAHLTEKLGNDIAKEILNSNLTQELNEARSRFEEKAASLKNEYKILECSLKEELNNKRTV